jgi:hypothetical protein
MWRLLRTEITYNRILLTILLGLYMPLLAVFAIFGGEEIAKSQPGIMGLMWALSVMFSVLYMIDQSKTRRVRLFMEAPIKPAAAAGTRMLLFLVFWGGLSAGFWAVHLVFHSRLFQWETLWGFLSLTGIVMFTHAGYMLAQDVRYFSIERRIFGLSAGELIGALIPFVLLTLFVLLFFSRGTFAFHFAREGRSVFSSPEGCAPSLTLGLAVSAIDAAVFRRRRVFSE